MQNGTFEIEKERILTIYADQLAEIRRHLAEERSLIAHQLIELLVCTAYASGGIDATERVRKLIVDQGLNVELI